MSNIQDLSIKKYITNPKIFCDLYNGGIFEGCQLLLPQHLQSLPSESYEIIQDKKGYIDITMLPSVGKGQHGRSRVNFVFCIVTFNRRTLSTPQSSALQNTNLSLFDS